MMNTVQASLCKMNSECENETHTSFVTAEFNKADCCKTEVVDNSIHDKYLQNSIQKLNLNQNIILTLNTDVPGTDNLLISSVKYFIDTSPPSLLSNHIYLNNSILLI